MGNWNCLFAYLLFTTKISACRTTLHIDKCQKCNTIWVSPSPKPIFFDYSIHDTVLENIPHTKYLGVTIQSNLKWDVHCKQVAAKATNTLNVLKWNLKYTKGSVKRYINHLYAHKLNMLPLYGLPGLLETKPKLKGYSVELLTMYITHSRYSSITAMLQSLDWETLESRRFNMHLCIIYKAYYNLAMFPLFNYATPVTVQTPGNNIKFILPHCSKDVFKHSFLLAALRGWNALPQSAVEAESLELFKASLPCVTY